MSTLSYLLKCWCPFWKHLPSVLRGVTGAKTLEVSKLASLAQIGLILIKLESFKYIHLKFYVYRQSHGTDVPAPMSVAVTWGMDGSINVRTSPDWLSLVGTTSNRQTDRRTDKQTKTHTHTHIDRKWQTLAYCVIARSHLSRSMFSRFTASRYFTSQHNK